MELTNRLRYSVVKCRNEAQQVYIKWLNSRGAWEFELAENTFEQAVQQTAVTTARKYDITQAWADQRGLDYTVNAETQESITCYIDVIPVALKPRYIDFMNSIQSEDVFMLQGTQWIRTQATEVTTNLRSNAQQFYIRFTLSLPARDL
jgi:hypothetical protein